MKKILSLLAVIVLGSVLWFFFEQQIMDFYKSMGHIKKNNTLVFSDENTGFSFNYPDYLIFRTKGDTYDNNIFSLTVDIDDIDSLNYSGFDKEKINQTIVALKMGSYGNSPDQSLPKSERITYLKGMGAQDFLVLSRSDVCDVVFERKLVFYKNNKRFVVTVNGPKDEIITSIPEHMTKDEENCGENSVWDIDLQNKFYNDLVAGFSSETAQKWFGAMDSITESANFAEKNSLLKGVWVSVADKNSTIEFNDSTEIDFYNGVKMSEGVYSLNEITKLLTITSEVETFNYKILELSAESLKLSFLPEETVLEFVRVEK
ncbi:MAG: hypothetical protein V1851_00815 [Patescibacteria group bacterium]